MTAVLDRKKMYQLHLAMRYPSVVLGVSTRADYWQTDYE
jgi:hypothetical protein